MTATKTRKKQQTELIKRALQAQDDKKREERENFLITTIPITVQAAYEPSPVGDDHDEGNIPSTFSNPRDSVNAINDRTEFPSLHLKIPYLCRKCWGRRWWRNYTKKHVSSWPICTLVIPFFLMLCNRTNNSST